MEIKTILKHLISRNNFLLLNVIGKVGNAKHHNITEAVNDLGYNHITLTMRMYDMFDMETFTVKNEVKNDSKTVLILDELDRATPDVFKKVVDGITYGNLFNLDLKDYVLVITSVEQLDIDLPLINRSIFIENK